MLLQLLLGILILTATVIIHAVVQEHLMNFLEWITPLFYKVSKKPLENPHHDCGSNGHAGGVNFGNVAVGLCALCNQRTRLAHA